MASVGDDTNDLRGFLEGPTDAQLLSKNILTGVITFDKGVVDDSDGNSLEIVASFEVAAGEQSGVHGLEVARTDNEKLRGGRFGRRGSGLVGRSEARAGAHVCEREKVSGAGRLYSGSAADFGEDAVEVLGALEIVAVAGGRSPDMHGEEMIGAETGIGGGEAGEAAQHEASADGEKKGEGDFGDNKDASKSLMATYAAAKRTLFECVGGR